MTIPYKELFSSNFFTREQVDILRRLAELLLLEGVGGGVADNTKADKVTLLIAGTGLQGGGDLSANRTFQLDLSFLDGRYPVIVDGKIAASVLPAVALADTFVVASQAAMLALAANQGDFAVRTDVNKTFVLGAEPASTLANWVEMVAGAGLDSFNGRVGTVVPATGDYTFAMIGSKPTTLSGYGITDAEPAIAAGTTSQYRRGDKTWQTLDKAAVGLANVDNTSDNAKPLGTQQLATLAAATGLALVGAKGPGTGALTRNMDAQFYERGLSLMSYAAGDGTADDTTAMSNWLAALATNKRRGFIPAGTYKVGDVTVTADYIEVECDPEAKFTSASGGTNPMITFTSSTGTSTARAGKVVWKGGQIDTSNRTYTTETTGIGLKIVNFANVTVEDVQFLGGADHEAAETAGKNGTGLYISGCDRSKVLRNYFRGYVEAGVLVSGGTLSGNSDDTVGHFIHGNHFVKCKYGWKALRTSRNVSVQGNGYDQCYIGGASFENGSARAARVSVTGEMLRRPGKHAFNLREQVGFVVANNVITDLGYKIDGVTTISAATALLLEGCTGGEVIGNVIRLDELAAFAGTYGIKNIKYVDGATTLQPTDVAVSNNHIAGVEFGVSEVGATGVNNRYRNNDFSNITTSFYDNIPAVFLPYGTYTPTLTNTLNVAASSGLSSKWRRVDRDIVVSLYFSADPTAAGAGEITVSLPVDPGADFTDESDAIGVAASGSAGTGAHGHIVAIASSRTVKLRLNFGTDVANHSWGATFSYRMSDGSAAPPPPPPAGSDLTDQSGQGITDQTGQQITVDVA